MAIGSICKTNVVTIKKGVTLAEVSRLMQEKHVGSVVVTENYSGREFAAGIITDRDIAVAVGAFQAARDLKVEEVMRPNPITVSKTKGIFETTEIMQRNGIKRLPVVNDDGSLYGVISADDLLDLLSIEMGNLAKLSDVQTKMEKGIWTAPRPQLQI